MCTTQNKTKMLQASCWTTVLPMRLCKATMSAMQADDIVPSPASCTDVMFGLSPTHNSTFWYKCSYCVFHMQHNLATNVV